MRLGIKTRVLILALVPTTAVSLIFFFFFINKQFSTIDAALTDKGNLIAKHLASASEYGIFSGNFSILKPLAKSALQDEDIISISITNHLGTPLIKLPEQSPTVWGNSYSTPNAIDNRIFSKPVVQNTIDISDFDDPNDTIPEILGWIVIEMSNKSAVTQKRSATYNTLATTILILVASIFLAIRISKRITQPILSLTNTVKEIESGNLDTPINTGSTGEFLALEQGFKKMTASLKSARQDFHNQIMEKTIGLRESLALVERQNDELKVARQDALSASRAKSEFLANISHEIRTPMNGILGFVKLLKKTNPNKEQQDYLDTIEKSANNLLRIINDILDLSKIEAGKLSIQDTSFNLQECVEDALLLMAPSAYEKNLDIINIHYKDAPTSLIGAPDRIRQILINLTNNAIKFSDHGSIIVRTILEARRENSVLIKITVTDQGVGISPIEQRHLFNVFTQLDNSKTRKHSGAGLGLAISKSLATAMNGDIGVDSHLNEGSTFWFTFECKLDDEESAFIEPPKQFTEQCAYVYDSNELSRLSICHSLEDLGFSVDEFSHMPDLAHHMSESRECQLCVLGLTRLEAQHSNDFKQLISLPAYQSTKSLFLINSADPSTLLRMREYGADACLSKPWKKTELSHTLTTLLIAGNVTDTDNQDNSVPFVANSASDTEHHLNNLKILIAEDNSINAKLLETVLQQAGARTKCVSNGNQAIDEFTTGNYNIILMDIHMPEVNGIEATRVIRFKEDGKSHIPILGLTANILDEDRKLCFSSGMNEVLIKPIAVDELLHEIDYWTHWRTKAPVEEESPSSKVSTQASTGTVRDVQQLGVNPELENALYKMLIDELPAFRKQLQQYFEQKDWASLREVCHKLLGGTSYCNVNELRNAVKQFQESLKHEADDLPAAFQALLGEIDRLTSKH